MFLHVTSNISTKYILPYQSAVIIQFKALFKFVAWPSKAMRSTRPNLKCWLIKGCFDSIKSAAMFQLCSVIRCCKKYIGPKRSLINFLPPLFSIFGAIVLNLAPLIENDY